MSQPPRQMHLNLTLHSTGFHDGAWLHPTAELDRIYNVKYFQRIARIAEEAKLDSIFIADTLYVQRESIKYGLNNSLDPVTLLTAIAGATEKIGLIGTISTSFSEPYNVARALATLDHISEGRAGWNIVTTYADAAALNFNLKNIPSLAERYERADEYVDVAIKLWDSWEDGAIVLDRSTGVYVDPDRVHEIHHQGKYFNVRGPLNVPRPPQGRPLLVQAGSSEAGRELAAKYAEAIYTAQQTLEEAKAFYQDLKARLPKHGRSPDQVKILPGICTIVGSTEAEAEEKFEELQSLASTEYSLLQLSVKFGIDLRGYPLDQPFPELSELTQTKDYQSSRVELISDMAKRESLTLRQLLARVTAGRGHGNVIGTPVQIADRLEQWFKERAADGFNIMPQLMPGGLEDFVGLVVPELRNRGLFRTEYTGHTLRDNYGLARPDNRYTKVAL